MDVYVTAYRAISVLYNVEMLWNAVDQIVENVCVIFTGTKMVFAGLKDKENRSDVISYLKEITCSFKETYID